MKLGLFKSLLIITIMLVGALFLPSHPSASSKTSQSVSSSPFASNIYKIATELKGPDKGDVSINYQAGPGNIWQSNGYNAELWAFCSDCHTYTTAGLPGNGGFEQPLTSNANDGKPFYTIQDASATVLGTYLAAQNTNLNFVQSLTASFHSQASVPGASFGWSGITQNFVTHFWYTPLVSDITFTGQLYPVKLDNATKGLDALIVFEFDLSYWNVSTAKNRMFFVFQNNATASLASFPYSNSTDAYTRVFALSGSTPLSFNHWNPLSWNITNIAIQSFGYWKGIDERITDLTVQSWSENGAASEFYLDSLGLTSVLRTTASSQTYHNTEESILSHYNSTGFPLVSGVTDWGSPQDIIWFGTTTYPGTGPASTNTQIGLVQSGGGYPFIAAPYDTSTVYNVSAVPVYSNAQSWAGASTQAGGSGLWDRYLTSGVVAMGFAEHHAYMLPTVDGYAVSGPATLVYSDSLSGTSIVEAIAQGRSFGEYGWFKTGTMSVYFAAQNDNVGMGRFPVYVDPSTTSVSLHVKLGNVPVLSSPLSLRIIRDGTVIDTVTLPSQATSYDNVLGPYPIPNTSDYFRFEVYAGSNPILAYSNPIFFNHANLLSGYWLAETPGFAFGTAKSFLSNILQTQTALQFTVNAPAGLPVTTKVFYPSSPGTVLGAVSSTYDPTSKILTVNTIGTSQVAVVIPRLNAIATALDNSLYWNGISNGAWSGWQSLLGSTPSQPALCSSGPSSIELVVRGVDNAIWHKSFVNGAWSSSWDSPGGGTADSPTCAVLNGNLYVVTRGMDNGIWYTNRTISPGAWSPWRSLEGGTPSAPMLVNSTPANRLDLVARGMDGTLWHKALTLGVWSPTWDSISSGSSPTMPAVASDGKSLHVVAVSMDKGIWYDSLNFTTNLWSGWTSLNGGTSITPGLTVDSSGALDVVAVDLNGGIWHRSKPLGVSWDATATWDSLGGYTKNSPGLVALGNSLVVFVRGPDQGIWYNILVGSAWSGWNTIGGATPGSPATFSTL